MDTYNLFSFQVLVNNTMKKYGKLTYLSTLVLVLFVSSIVKSNAVESREYNINDSERLVTKGNKKSSILNYLQSLQKNKKNRVLSGQNIGHANFSLVNAYQKYFKQLKEQTGLLPAILGIDYGSETFSASYIAQANRLLLKHWNKGGLVTVSFSPSNPWTGGGLKERFTGSAKYLDIIKQGTEANKRWYKTLDSIAYGLSQLRDAGVIVLFRPLHEMNGDFFWWSTGSDSGWAYPNEFKKLWIDTYNYFTKTKQLDNLLWVYAPNYQSNNEIKPVDYYYPGSSYVDIGGLDFYDNNFDRLSERQSYKKMLALKKPLGLTEVGPAFWWGAHPQGEFDTQKVIKAIRNKYPSIVYFMFWQGWSTLFSSTKMAIVENKNAKQLLQDPWVITLDEVNWKQERFIK